MCEGQRSYKRSSRGSVDVLWNIENDVFGFKVALKSKPMTRRSVLSVLSLVYDLLRFGAPFLLKEKQILQSCVSKV